MTMYPNGSTKPPKVSSPFGPRAGGAFSTHYGADLIGFENVHAVKAGTVTFAGWMNSNAGNTVTIDHGAGITSVYMHLERVSVSRGARVGEGAKVGEVGSTGNATGDCLHYEIRLNGRSVEPMGWTAGQIAPAKPAKPGTAAPAFPLPRTSYFGPKEGPKASVSGYYSHRADLRRWQQRMKDRGWNINPDGLYGRQTGDVAAAFQREKGLTVDRKIGPATWAAAWTAPIT